MGIAPESKAEQDEANAGQDLPYFLCNMMIDQPNQLWSAHITYSHRPRCFTFVT
ncbi:hypothetical protein ACVWZ4_000941 [Bradyrhizobium sp. USDA 4472]